MWILFDAACVAFLFSLLFTPFVRNWAIRFRLFDMPDSDRKMHSSPIPRLGGVGVVAAYLLSLVFVAYAPYRGLLIDVPQTLSRVIPLVIPVCIVMAIGIIDDIRGLSPWQKLAGEVVAALLAYYGGFGITVLWASTLSAPVSLAITVIWLVGCANALNMIDGMDGLAAGISGFASLTILVSSLISGNVQLALVTAPLVGSLVGFLRYNFNPASIFLGDSGSLVVGFLLGCYGVMWSHKSATLLGITAPLMSLAIPLLDVGLAVLRRFLSNKPVLGADRDHIHHKLLKKGFTPKRAVLVLYGVAGLVATFSLLQESAGNSFGGVIIVLFCAAAWIGVQNLGYLEFDLARKFLLAGALRQMIGVQVQIQEFGRTLGQSRSLQQASDTLVNLHTGLGFCGVRVALAPELGPSVETGRISNDCWQIRIPLPDADGTLTRHAPQHIVLFRDTRSKLHPIVLGETGEIIAKIFGELIAEASRKLEPADTQPAQPASAPAETFAGCGGDKEGAS